MARSQRTLQSTPINLKWWLCKKYVLKISDKDFYSPNIWNFIKGTLRRISRTQIGLAVGKPCFVYWICCFISFQIYSTNTLKVRFTKYSKANKRHFWIALPWKSSRWIGHWLYPDDDDDDELFVYVCKLDITI